MNKSNTASSKLRNFISPATFAADSIEWEWCDQNGIKGIVIDQLNEKDETVECFFLQADQSDVEEWIYDNGYEDQDFTWEGEWDDSEGERGGMVNKRMLIESELAYNTMLFILDSRKDWKQHQ
jgi:hypothetical protein